jgi:hypothetical protein
VGVPKTQKRRMHVSTAPPSCVLQAMPGYTSTEMFRLKNGRSTPGGDAEEGIAHISIAQAKEWEFAIEKAPAIMLRFVVLREGGNERSLIHIFDSHS